MVGFNQEQRADILKNHMDLFEDFDRSYSYFERAKVSGNTQKVPDGVNLPALYNMRKVLKDLPAFFLENQNKNTNDFMPASEFFNMALSGYAKSRDARIGKKHEYQIRKIQTIYKKLIDVACAKKTKNNSLKAVFERAQILNSNNRITGNALIEIVDEVLQSLRKGQSSKQVQALIDRLLIERSHYPEVLSGQLYKQLTRTPLVSISLYTKIQNIVIENFETI
jgi:hypothetical protein